MVEKPKKPGKSPIEVTAKEALPELEVQPGALDFPVAFAARSRNRSGGHTQKDASASNRQDARPEGAEIAHGLKSGFATGKEIPQAQPAVHEIQEIQKQRHSPGCRIRIVDGEAGRHCKRIQRGGFQCSGGD